MKGLLTVIQVTRPEPTDTDPKTAEIVQWIERDQIGRGAILSALSNTLFDVYCSDSYTAKSLWDELDRKYNTEEQGLEKYSISKFMRYQMVEDRLDTRPSFVLIKRPRLGRQLSTWLWEVLAVLAPQEQRKGHHWKDSKHGELQYC
ncbi:UNVERIFIED_CONTAM: hypothetical protein Scaly_0694800 [Sesamum calycinum]|uniref:Zinc finger, CCHC-type n=1 Tax=Sesamum calycinum TaxID=2727403 RepID=A0AAW2R6J8_9LAMI